MSPTDLTGIRAQALQAAATLARYERHVRRLAATWLDMDVYRTVSAEIDAIGQHCLPLPGVAYPWAALLTSHADLVHALLAAGARPHDGSKGAPTRDALHRHLACIDTLARRCLQVAEASHRGAAMASAIATASYV
jgi:hypothetical protein